MRWIGVSGFTSWTWIISFCTTFPVPLARAPRGEKRCLTWSDRLGFTPRPVCRRDLYPSKTVTQRALPFLHVVSTIAWHIK
ncbi:hypothetical protein H4582DRAFT_1962281 [Lactarius indigo]|nr:hypothetical protein H4582DRAFT_1962281 [Lactarius indigo]